MIAAWATMLPVDTFKYTFGTKLRIPNQRYHLKIQILLQVLVLILFLDITIIMSDKYSGYYDKLENNE